MKYQSGGAFRRALEDKLRTQSLRSGIALVRLRKMVTFDRLLARLMLAQPDSWVLKGGLALQLRLGDRARMTKDIDVLLVTRQQDIHQHLVSAALLDTGDWFQIEVAQPAPGLTDHFGGLRFQLQSILDGRLFEKFHMDVGVGDPIVEPLDYLSMPELLGFAGIRATVIPCYPLTQQIAEKIHAYTRPRPIGEGSRAKDLVDILLMAGLEEINAPVLFQAIQVTFDVRGTHPLPTRLPDPPFAWSATFRRMAEEVSLDYRALADAIQAARRFLDPVMQGNAAGAWNPTAWTWQS